MIYLLFATFLNASAYAFMKQSEGFSKLTPTVLTFAAYLTGVFLFAVAMRNIDVSLVYVISFGLGTLLVTAAGYFFFNEAINPPKLIAMLIVLGGVISLTTMN